jgi:hypothetical protein
MAVPATVDEQLAQQRERLRLVPSDETPPSEEVREQVRRWQEHVHQSAETIRWADEVIEKLASTPYGEDPESLLPRVRELRAEAFARMQRLNPDQAWFWTEEWQEGERECDRDEAAGRSSLVGGDEEFDAYLRSLRPDIADLYRRPAVQP